jgi:hypothetical protein
MHQLQASLCGFRSLVMVQDSPCQQMLLLLLFRFFSFFKNSSTRFFLSLVVGNLSLSLVRSNGKSGAAGIAVNLKDVSL